MKIHFRTIASAMLIAIGSCATAQETIDADSIDIEEDIEEAIDIDSIAAQAARGDESAMLRISYEYNIGENLPRDDEKAFEWAVCAADIGQPGRAMVAYYLYNGVGTAPDPEGAKLMLRKLNEEGYEKAGPLLEHLIEQETYTLLQLEQEFVPTIMLISQMMPDALVSIDDWEELLTSWGKDKFDFSWSDIKAEQSNMGKEKTLTVYTFPYREEPHHAPFGAIYSDKANSLLHYYTVEYGEDSRWHLCGKSLEGVDEDYGVLAGTPTKDSFVKHVKKEVKKP